MFRKAANIIASNSEHYNACVPSVLEGRLVRDEVTVVLRGDLHHRTKMSSGQSDGSTKMHAGSEHSHVMWKDE